MPPDVLNPRVRRQAAVLFAAAAVAWALVIAGTLPPAAALLGSAAPAPVPVRAAGDELDVATSAAYEVDAKTRRVRVAVDLEAVNRKPVTSRGGVVTRYRYDTVTLAVPPDATRIRASQGGTALDPDVTRRDGYKVVSIPFASPLYFGDRASLAITFDLPAGKPRSNSGVRIGEAFISFPVWAYGDRGTVKVVVPPGYEVATRGRTLEATTSAKGATVLAATTEEPLAWSAFVDATNAAALTAREVVLPGGDRVLLQGWPEDAKWERVAARQLQAGIPGLQRRIGLPWPVDGILSVTEVHTPLLEGYAGFYDPATSRITIGEKVDRLTIIHEASHAWFNGRLFTDRWITEGLAEEYASRVVRDQGVEVAGPPKVKRGSKGSFALGSWPPPSAIGDQAAARRERYGYAASWTVMRKIVNAAGEEGMRRVFAAAAAGSTAYPGDGPAEPSSLPNDWRRLVDLAEELGGADDVATLVATWALPEDAAPPLAARSVARTAYRALVERGDGWAAPVAVRRALDAWAFEDAQRSIGAAGSVLDARDALAAGASGARLVVPAPLEAAYEGAASDADLAAVRERIDRSARALESLGAAERAAAEPRDWLADLGLEDEDPAASLAAARAAWSAGDAAAASTQAEALAARLANATDAGTRRLLALAAVPAILAAALVIVGLVAGLRRRPTRPERPA